MSVYRNQIDPSAGRLWIVNDGVATRYFATEREAYVASRKNDFATEYAAKVKTVIDTLNSLVNLKAEFIALDYATGMTDADVASLGVTKAELIAASVAVDALVTTMNTGTNAKALYTVGG